MDVGTCPQSSNYLPGYYVTLCNDFLTLETSIFTHEMGHFLFNACDEYVTANPPPAGSYDDEPRCGHSVMAGYDKRQAFQFCTDIGHGRDSPQPTYSVVPTCSGTTYTEHGSWHALALKGLPPRSYTTSPDPVDLRYHDFNGQIPLAVY